MQEQVPAGMSNFETFLYHIGRAAQFAPLAQQEMAQRLRTERAEEDELRREEEALRLQVEAVERKREAAAARIASLEADAAKLAAAAPSLDMPPLYPARMPDASASEIQARTTKPDPVIAPALVPELVALAPAEPEPVVAPEPVEAKQELPVAPVVDATGEPEVVPQVESTPVGPLKHPQYTVPERFGALMGDKVWDGPSLEKKLIEANDDVSKSNNPRSYILSVWSTATTRILGTDGDCLKDHKGKIVKVHCFVSVDRGRYRVATMEEMQREAAAILAKRAGKEPPARDPISEPVSEPVSESERTPADDVFEEQGINIKPALGTTAH
jgi:hypothetical protein